MLIFSKTTCSQAKVIEEIFTKFSLLSSLKVNLDKSRAFYSKGIPRGKIARIMAISSICRTLSIGKYLGFPIIQGRAKKEDFLFIIEKMQARLASWKNKLLNKAEWLTLVK